MNSIVATLVVMAVALCGQAASAQPASWDSIELPASAPQVRDALGIRAASPASGLILEVARRYFYLPGRNDARQPGFARLEQVLNAPGAGEGARVVPLPGGAALWEHATGLSGGALARALLLDRNAALLYTGLASLDRDTLAFVAGEPALVREIFRGPAAVFAAFGGAIRVRAGRVDVPGGPGAEALWTQLVRASPASPAPFIEAVLKGGGGRLAYFYDALASLDEARLRFVFGPAPGRDGRFLEIARIFESVEPAWRVASQPFLRPMFDPAFALRFARLPRAAESGEDVYALAYLREIFGASPASRRATDASAAARRAFDAAAAAARAGAALGAVRAARPALAMTLERIGVTDAALVARVDRAAAALDARLTLREELTIAWQGSLTLLAAAARHGSVEPAERDAALGALAGTVEARDPFTALLDWLDARVPGAAALEAALVDWAAGPRVLQPLEWEGQPLDLDMAGSRRAALARMLDHPRRLTLDDIAALRRAHERVASADPLDAAALGADLGPVLVRYASAARVHPPLAAGADAFGRLMQLAPAGPIDPQARQALSVELLAARRAALADAMRLIAYAHAVNGPGMLATSAADFARRHIFEPPARVSLAPVGPWEPAVIAAGGGLRLEGSLLNLDLAIPEMMLRRPPGEMPAEPAMLAGERAAFARAALLAGEPARLAQEAGTIDIAGIARAIAAGRREVAAAADPAAFAALAERAAMAPMRAGLLAWEAARDPDAARRRFSLAELAAIGGLPRVPAALGTSRMALDGCPCAGSPPPPFAWRDLAGRWDSGLLAAASPDLALRLIELAAEADLPAAIVAPLLLVATSDVIERADPADPDDREAIARAVATIDAGRFEQYMLALIPAGTLVPRGELP